MFSPQNTEIQLYIKELRTYGRNVEEISCKDNKWVLRIDPPYNGNNTIEIECMHNPKKELENAIKYIRSIPEFEKIRDKNLEIKSRIISKFKQAYVGPTKPRSGILRKFYHGKPIKTPEDFYQFFEDLIDLATSNFVLPKQLKQIINMYKKKKPHEKIILPPVGKYGWVNLDDVKVVQQPYTIPKEPTPKLPREIFIRKKLMMDVAIEDANREKSIEQDEKMIASDIFYRDLIANLEKELTYTEQCNSDSSKDSE
ncbi:MAG: hypothetical protein QMD36_00720 [Candidatus Aenigmarchaeota archaeon]|nr:hypothetical protein [Candidatus Aenigmarchaeota archaeon]